MSGNASLPTIHDRVERGTVIHVDEASHWDVLTARYLTRKINHSEAYSAGEACTNWAESFFSRMRRAEIGIHHRIAGRYLSAYAGEMAWREDNRPHQQRRTLSSGVNRCAGAWRFASVEGVLAALIYGPREGLKQTAWGFLRLNIRYCGRIDCRLIALID